MTIPTGFSVWECGWVSRKEIAQALNMVLFIDLLARVPSGREYTEDVAARGGKVFHDHGALRTVRWNRNGALPPGEVAFTRILEPLGYRLNGVFRLDRIGMTGRSYAHADNPEEIAQFFVSELHPERFSSGFQDAVTRVLSTSKDPLSPHAQCLLHELARDGRLTFDDAADLLPQLETCFGRQHAIPTLADYEILLAESHEMAWIATEGNAFNHVTDRVGDLERLTREQAALGRPMKKAVEVSQSGRIRQTAFRADPVIRRFGDGQGGFVQREVPGSFYEFISRDRTVDGDALDLGFDAGNAQAIFKMTASAR
ncbi:calmodulin-binding protein [Noviherbaspirillum denitrificans]|uniref:2-oxoadipate dioxygenase/decarboxylase n=2 Tax=Noviherbaspirillum denitrificans TaxID=1968433 RepID=A0A254T872_9BURK|nr:calmodulin-binding protein [Noviherbaspirillum denitrificans]